MSGGGSTKMNEEYFTEHPWSGDNGSHEDWEKVLALKALSIGGDLMYQWARGEGPEISWENIETIGARWTEAAVRQRCIVRTRRRSLSWPATAPQERRNRYTRPPIRTCRRHS